MYIYLSFKHIINLYLLRTSVFAFNGSAASFADLAASMQGALDENLIRLDSDQLTGEIRRAEIDGHLSVIDWTLNLKEGCTFRNQFVPDPEGWSHLLTYFFDPAYPAITFRAPDQPGFISGTPTLLILAKASELEFSYPPASNIRCISIALTERWLQKQTSNIKSYRPAGDALLLALRNVTCRPLSRGELFFAKELYNEFHGPAHSLLIRTHVYNLLAVLYRHLNLQGRNAERRRENPVIWQVEKELLQHLHTAPPSIDDLARKFFLSASTLQRHFKSVFGMNAYEYYLRKKMDEAKKLLRSGQSVNTVSYALGYESVSHFIRIFKKMVGENPGRYKKISGFL